MNLAISLHSELSKIKRTAAFYLCLLVAAVVPTIFMINLLMDGPEAGKLHKDPWNIYLLKGFQISGMVFFPLFVILLCTLVMQVEFRNNTWKQVYSSPQPLWHITASKLLVLHILVLFFLFSFNVFLFIALLIAGAFLPSMQLFTASPDWGQVLQLNIDSYLLVAGMLSIQFWLSMRIRNFIAPLGIGFALWFAGGLLALDMHWSFADRYPHGYPWMMVSKDYASMEIRIKVWSVVYAVVFFGIALLDLQRRKSKV